MIIMVSWPPIGDADTAGLLRIQVMAVVSAAVPLWA